MKTLFELLILSYVAFIRVLLIQLVFWPAIFLLLWALYLFYPQTALAIGFACIGCSIFLSISVVIYGVLKKM